MKKYPLKGEWRLKDLEDNKGWLLELDLEDKQDIIFATKAALSLKKNIFDISNQDFPLNKFLTKIEKVKAQVESGLGFIILRGLPIEEFKDDEVKVMLWGLGQYIGYPEVQDKAGALLHVVTDTGASDNLISALHKRRYIETAQRFSDVPKLTNKQIEALNLVDTLCANESFCLSMQLNPGDLEIASNATTFHSRENYEDYPNPNERRCMLRLWLSLFKPRPLPEIYRNTREWGPTFKRRDAH